MASNVIDLISSSPPRDITPPRHVVSQPYPAASSLAQIEIHSDDFCSSGEDTLEDVNPVNQPVAKRPRLSPEAGGSQGRRPMGSSAGAQPFEASGQRSKTLADDIEFVSSIEAHSFAPPKPRTTSLKRSRTEPLLPCSSLIPDSDPFASSPTRVAAKPIEAQISQDLLSDPFASSPRRTVAKSKHARIAQDLLSDPFASSSPARAAVPSHIPSTTLVRDHTRPRGTVAAWDPISSSAPCSSAPPKTAAAPSNRLSRSPSVISIGDSSASSDGDLPAIGSFDLSQGRPSYHNYLSTSAPKKPKSANNSVRKAADPKQSRPRQTTDPGERAAAKALEKEQKRQQREREKEERQRQRDVAAAIVEVNKAKGNRKVSSKEMITDIPLSLPSTIKVQLETLLDGLDIQHRNHDSPVHNVVKWRRKVNSRFDDESGQWVPTPLRIENEGHALLFMTAEDMVQLAVHDGLDEHMTSVRSECPDEKLIYILQGVTAWMRKNRNTRNRQFAAGVRSQNESQPTSGRRRAEPAEYIDEDMVEDAMLRLQVEHDVLIHHTAIPLETAQWISIFTQNISTIPYKKQKDEDTAGARFCMDSGQVRTGENTQDTYVRMLQEIFRVTAPIAYGVASEFGTITKLVEGMETKGPTALEQVRKSANKDGAFSDRAIGPAVSKRLYKIFTGTDETSTDV